jgi:hypothetical protein
MSTNKIQWLQSIAEKSKTTVNKVENILLKHHIRPTPVMASPHRLVLNRLMFSGTKVDVSHPGPFEFDWEDLTGGLWSVLSKKNLRGKSTIIEVIRWLLRGRPSSNLQEDVKSWIDKAELHIRIDNVYYSISFETKTTFAGKLTQRREAAAKETVLAEFFSEDEFEAAMSDFFLRMFSMDSIINWKNSNNDDEVGSYVSHDWCSFSGAMFIGTDYSSLLGEIPVNAGLTARMLQMYLGMPWVSTIAAAKTAIKAEENTKKVDERHFAFYLEKNRQRAVEIKAEIETKQQKLKGLPSHDKVRNEMTELSQRLFADLKYQGTLAKQQTNYENVYAQAENDYQNDARALQTHIDSTAAGAIFRMLEPSCCPRCDIDIDAERKQKEIETHACSVCGETLTADEDDFDILKQLEDRKVASKKAFDKVKRKQKSTKDELKTVEKSNEKLQLRLDELANSSNNYQRQVDLKNEISKLQGMFEEVTKVPAPTVKISDELRILKVTSAVTESLIKLYQVDLLKMVSERIVDYARRFGMTNLQEANLKGNANLLLVKGSVMTSYSKVTDGEKLRLKVATVLAMLEIAESKGIGRHPGLLVIDSPAAQEVTQEDVDQIVSGLAGISKELPFLQVFVSGVNSPAIKKHIPANRSKEAIGDEYLW